MPDYDFRLQSSYVLPPLPYSYDALEPVISSKIIETHYLKHHKSYVDNLNKAITKLQQCRETSDYDGIKGIQRDISFNLSGHILHSMYWNSMSPEGSNLESSPLTQEIADTFGSIESFKKEFVSAGSVIEGSGWIALVRDHMSGRLILNSIENHQNQVFIESKIHLICDVWEHAYYLDYLSDRNTFIEKWLTIAHISARL